MFYIFSTMASHCLITLCKIVNFVHLLYFQGLEPGDTGTVRRRQKTVVTPKMAMESFRYSFMSGKYGLKMNSSILIQPELQELWDKRKIDTAGNNFNLRLCFQGTFLSRALACSLTLRSRHSLTIILTVFRYFSLCQKPD